MSRARLKICHLTESFFPRLGGMQVVVDNLAHEMAARGHEVTVVCPEYPGMDGPQPKTGYRINRCFGSTPVGFALGVLPWRRLPAREGFDIIHAHNVWPGGTLALTAKKTPAKVVVTSHGRDILTDVGIKYGSRLNPLVAAIIKQTLVRIDAHTVVSSSMADAAREAGTALDKLTIVPNFLDPDKAPAGGDSIGGPASGTEKYLLMVGRLHAVKGFDLALKAFSQAKAEFPGLKIKIAGTGTEGERLKRLAAELGIEDSVDWLGQVTGLEKNRLTEGARAVLITSRVESFCLAALEAMALGAPVIAPGRAPFTDIIDGRNSLLFEPEEPQSLITALRRLEEKGVAAKLTQRAMRTAARFTRAAAVDRYEEIYYRLIGEKREPAVRKRTR